MTPFQYLANLLYERSEERIKASEELKNSVEIIRIRIIEISFNLWAAI
jgi:hypothetical protein